MEVQSILVVCVGNICRSPTGERLLRARLPDLRVESAGLAALVGSAADGRSSAVAEAQGVSLAGHVARQFTPAMGTGFDLILVMETAHRARIARMAPQLLGRTMLFDHWTGSRGIPDPYGRLAEMYESTFSRLSAAADAWSVRLRKRVDG
ncbi:phosphotyrosine protein phosphatase [Cereibacter azotoformans]|uniref:protein-tyrosine-phosphatase n=1 Tax=Cereibacter azotoformans TaxID=43057 RepID=A0A2T5JT28_9RHOB|nr:phosphotyrosine protein phosphatase [Cereibacter azotoformans]PTR11614.1 protein-tyrosine phosphatase [Cereibacter azotoformans]